MQSTPNRLIQITALALALAYPATHFVTRLEDPVRYEPLWQYQLISLMFLGVFGATWAKLRERRLFVLYEVAAFVAAGWAMWSAYNAGYEGKRLGLLTLTFIAAVGFERLRLLVVYIVLLFGAILIGTSIKDPHMDRSVILGRVLIIALMIVSLGVWRAWTVRRAARSEQKLQQVILGCPLPCLLIERGRCLLNNQAAHRLLSISPGDALGDVFGAHDPWWSSAKGEGQVLMVAHGVDGQERQCEVVFACVDADADIKQAIFIDKTLSTPSHEIKRLLIAHINRRLRPHVIGLQQALHAAAPEDPHVAGALEAVTQLDRALDDLLLSSRIDATPPASDLADPLQPPHAPDLNTPLWPNS